jgi:hypothetical protein
MIPGALVSGEFTLGLISKIRIWSAGKSFSKVFKSPSSVSPNHLALRQPISSIPKAHRACAGPFGQGKVA